MVTGMLMLPSMSAALTHLKLDDNFFGDKAGAEVVSSLARTRSNLRLLRLQVNNLGLHTAYNLLQVPFPNLEDIYTDDDEGLRGQNLQMLRARFGERLHYDEEVDDEEADDGNL